MKILLRFFVLISLLVVTAHGWAVVYSTDNSTDHPGYCYNEDKEIGAMEKYEVKNLKSQCGQITCNEDSTVYVVGCGVISPLKRCSLLPEDLSKLHPDCCEKLVCEGDRKRRSASSLRKGKTPRRNTTRKPKLKN